MPAQRDDVFMGNYVEETRLDTATINVARKKKEVGEGAKEVRAGT